MRIRAFALPLVLASLPLLAQTPANPLSFEVASVKLASPPIATKDDYSAGYNAGMRAALATQGMRISGQRVNITDNTLKDLIRLAYQVKDYQISAPGWMSTEKYEIVANMPAGATPAQAPAMLRTLLETRFHLQLDRQTKSMPVYALVALKGGPKLTPSTATGRSMTSSRPGRVLGQKATLDSLAAELSKVSDRPVIDTTGLAALFDFDLRYSADLNAPPDSAPPLSTVLQELGLKLEKRDMPLELLTVEKADRVPVEN